MAIRRGTPSKKRNARTCPFGDVALHPRRATRIPLNLDLLVDLVTGALLSVDKNGFYCRTLSTFVPKSIEICCFVDCGYTTQKLHQSEFSEEL